MPSRATRSNFRVIFTDPPSHPCINADRRLQCRSPNIRRGYFQGQGLWTMCGHSRLYNFKITVLDMKGVFWEGRPPVGWWGAEWGAHG